MLVNETKLARKRWLSVLNGAGQDIPAFACVYPSAADSAGIITVTRHTVDSEKMYLFNGPRAIPSGKYGHCTLSMPCHVLYDTTYGTPANGQRWGTIASSFKIGKDGRYGFVIVGGVTSGRVIVSPEFGITKAKMIHFSLRGSLAVTDVSQTNCTVQDYWQGGNPGTTVTVWNHPASSNYMFSGAAGKWGTASYDDIDDKYRIIQLEC